MVESSFPKINGDTLYASEVNTFNAGNSFKKFKSLPTESNGILTHSSTTWTTVNATNSMRTTNAGSTWTNCTSDSVDVVNAVLNVNYPGSAFAFNSANNNGATSIDSGDNWTARSALAGGSILCASYPASSKLVIGTSSGARTIFTSINGGVSFTICTAGPTAATACISMFNTGSGFAIDTTNNVWYTQDGGANWTDTTKDLGLLGPHDFAKAIQNKIYALNGSTYLFADSQGDLIAGDNAGNSRTMFSRQIAFTPGSVCSNIIYTSSGNVYFAVYDIGPMRDSYLFKANYSTGSYIDFCVMNMNDMRSSGCWMGNALSEYTPSKVLIAGQSTYKLLDDGI